MQAVDQHISMALNHYANMLEEHFKCVCMGLYAIDHAGCSAVQFAIIFKLMFSTCKCEHVLSMLRVDE